MRTPESKMLDTRTLWGDVCSSTVCVTVYLSVCMVVCVQVYIFLVWECDSQNETSQQRRPGRRSIPLADVCGRNPLSLCVKRWCEKLVGKSLGSQDACLASPYPPLVLSFSVFFMIRDKIMSLSSTPENISQGCIIAV